MLDGAGASTFLDLIDERNQEDIKKNSKIIDTTKDNNEVPFANTARDQNKKNVVFIVFKYCRISIKRLILSSRAFWRFIIYKI